MAPCGVARVRRTVRAPLATSLPSSGVAVRSTRRRNCARLARAGKGGAHSSAAGPTRSNTAVAERAGIRRGFAHHYRGDLAGAIADFDKALALDPNVITYINRGLVRYQQGDRKGARADFERARAITTDPQLQKQLNQLIAALR